jgi:copper(I)-binding protein
MFLRSMLAATLIAGGTASACELEVVDAWIRPAPPTTGMRAAYITLHNIGSEACRITGASSDSFRSVSIHRTITEDGVSRMRPLGDAVIEPGATLAMEPGGVHVMLMGRPADPQAPVTVNLQLEDGETLGIELRLEVSP